MSTALEEIEQRYQRGSINWTPEQVYRAVCDIQLLIFMVKDQDELIKKTHTMMQGASVLWGSFAEKVEHLRRLSADAGQVYDDVVGITDRLIEHFKSVPE